ncbi:MAG: serine protease [Acidobacteriota bacterium]|jgi:subtilisin family serine protease
MYQKSKHCESDEARKNPWVPGLVEVKFRSANDSGLHTLDFSKPLERTKRHDRWSPELSHILTRSKLLTWRPSFPLRYSWSKETEEEARKFYSTSGRDRLITFRFPDNADTLKIAKELQSLPEVTRANPVAKVAPPSPIHEPLLGTSDVDITHQWYAFRCKLPEALETVTGAGVIVAVIDWGFDDTHNDYGPNIQLKKNIYNDNTVVSEGGSFEHGTASMGLAGARLNNIGMVGFAPGSILWAIQAGSDENVNYTDWATAIDFVRSEPALERKVIIFEIQTQSGGNIECIEAINQAIRDAIAANIVVCVPAGNNPDSNPSIGEDDTDIPETCSVLVGATDHAPHDNFVNSNAGPRVVVYAPGDGHNDLTCRSRNRHKLSFGGTSGAVAKVGGAVALMLEANPTLTPVEVRDILRNSTIPVRRGLSSPMGVLLDCQQAVYDARNTISQHRVCTAADH